MKYTPSTRVARVLIAVGVRYYFLTRSLIMLLRTTEDPLSVQRSTNHDGTTVYAALQNKRRMLDREAHIRHYAMWYILSRLYGTRKDQYSAATGRPRTIKYQH